MLNDVKIQHRYEITGFLPWRGAEGRGRGDLPEWGMTEDRLFLIDTFAFILSVSARRIRETSPRGGEVARG